MPFPAGTVLAGKYRIERLLGEGGMGWVVVATHLHLEQRVALKFMHAAAASAQPDAVGRFLREARAAARIQSEHVARVSDVGTLDNGAPYLVMEYLEGHDLDAELRRRSPLPTALAIDYALQACEGLAEAHAAGIVHRDLKPANLFLARKSDGSVRVKLLDFGISKLLPAVGAGGSGADVGMTSTQALMGSPLYMSPEQLRSSKNVDRRTDIWSMGIILYEMLGGTAPYQADTLPEVCARILAEQPPSLGSLRADLPPMLEAVVMRCLDKHPAKRFQDAGALAQALAAFGGPEARVAAERVGRVVRASLPSLPDARADASGPSAPMTAQAASGAVQTNVSFGTAGPVGPPRRSAVLPIAIGGAVVALAAIAIGIAATHGRSGSTAAAAGGSASAAAATTAAAAASSAPSPTPAPSASPAAAMPTQAPSAAPTAAPRATAVATTTARPKATPVATGRSSKSRPTGSGTAKPAGTSGFGGRD